MPKRVFQSFFYPRGKGGGTFLCFLEETVRWAWYDHCICGLMQPCSGCLLVQLVACSPPARGFWAGLPVSVHGPRARALGWFKTLNCHPVWVRVNGEAEVTCPEWSFASRPMGQNPEPPGSWKGKKVQCLASQQECPGFKSPSGQGHFRVFWLPPTAHRHIFGDRQIGVWEWMVVCSKLACVRGVDDLSPGGRWDLLQLLPPSPNGGGCVDLKPAAESSQYLLKRHLDIHRCGWDGSANG